MIVNRLSLACWRYRVCDKPPNFSIANGDPNPLWPTGGNLADCTIFLASSAVRSKGTIIPWADARMSLKRTAPIDVLWLTARVESAYGYQLSKKKPSTYRLRLTIQPSLAAILTRGLTPQAAIAATASCILLSNFNLVWHSCLRRIWERRRLCFGCRTVDIAMFGIDRDPVVSAASYGSAEVRSRKHLPCPKWETRACSQGRLQPVSSLHFEWCSS